MHIEESLKQKVEAFLNKTPEHMGHTLGIEFSRFTRDKVEATMPVDKRTVQPFGILHGGASVVLAETLASIGAWLNVDEGKTAVGVEINANHLRAVPKGEAVTGVATPVKRGRRIHVWDTLITDQNGKKVCTSRCTLAIIDE